MTKSKGETTKEAVLRMFGHAFDVRDKVKEKCARGFVFKVHEMVYQSGEYYYLIHGPLGSHWKHLDHLLCDYDRVEK